MVGEWEGEEDSCGIAQVASCGITEQKTVGFQEGREETALGIKKIKEGNDPCQSLWVPGLSSALPLKQTPALILLLILQLVTLLCRGGGRRGGGNLIRSYIVCNTWQRGLDLDYKLLF